LLGTALLFSAGFALDQTSWVVHRPTAIRQPGRLRDPRIGESSAVIRGKVNPAVLWTLNDSGNPPQLFAVDTTGTTRAVYRVAGVANIDWEALSAGPCGDRWCLWIGDIGDNHGIRRTVAIHRVVEPALTADPRERWISPLDSLVARYPDGPHDAEALVVTATGSAAIITKGRDGWIGMYRVPSAFVAVEGGQDAGARLGPCDGTDVGDLTHFVSGLSDLVSDLLHPSERTRRAHANARPHADADPDE